ncbi:unnamed protein product [Miscanthus lutarioriparius]|uniref:Uncharacterized protein n=1 Tax=Miscanthus lutarioriparius TaxID=422564 RepID=A0A811QE79_9POAL|nr:unnamed protein product [Miscanthus lutarioriparius]
MSNYMVYLLFVNPEMLMTGARRFLFREAYRQLKETLKLMPQLDDGAGPLRHDGGEFFRKIVQNIQQASATVDSFGHRFTYGVWVEMLCFSAGRCRGYLHAKSLGMGGECLSYIWLLMSYMGMETLSERMQRTKLKDEDARNNGGSSNGTTATASSSSIATGGSGNGTAAAIPVSAAGGGHGDDTTEASTPVTEGGDADGTIPASPVTTTNPGGDGTTAASPVTGSGDDND